MRREFVKVIHQPKAGDVLDATATMYPSRLEVVEGHREICDRTVTSYGYVVAGRAEIAVPHFRVRAEQGSFFCVPGEFLVESRGRVVLIQRLGFRAMLTAGRIEDEGRLTYIGCSSSILVPPPRVGDPVFNHLHIPGGFDQAQHTHPSIRLGVIARGSGLAYSSGYGGSGAWEERLEPGTVFLLDAHELHSFSTVGTGGLDVVTYHPDSDWGPTDGEHPMLTRTHLAGQK
jgi:hypothetical protein